MTVQILKSVGKGGMNLATDVMAVKRLLNVAVALPKMKVDGTPDQVMLDKIIAFQGTFTKSPDGLVKPGDQTLDALNVVASAKAAPTQTKKKIVNVLIDLAALRNLQFSIGTIQVKRKYIYDVGDKIDIGEIPVVVQPKLSTDAMYHGDQNRLLLKNDSPSLKTVQEKALFVHEAVHAANDVQKIGKVNKMDEEAAGFIAQAVYVYTNFPDKTKRITDADKKVDKVFEAAHAAAAQLVSANVLGFVAAVADVKKALGAAPFYSSFRKAQTNHDGHQ